MLNFREWVHKLDQSQIDAIYDKAHIAVDLVNFYNPQLLERISTIANLATGAYGLYNSGENSKKLPLNVERWLVYRGVKKEDISKVPSIIYKKWGIEPEKFQIGDTIHVNVRRILSQSKNDLDAVLQIASTIIHEATHEKEREETGTSSETAPKTAEHQFMNWAAQKIKEILKRYPELSGTYGIQDLAGRQ